MQTHKDQVDAYQFMMQRMSAALLLGDPSIIEPPTRRGRNAMVAGTAVAVLVAVGFGLYGLFVPGGNKAYAEPGSIVVEKESGSRFVFVGGALRPTPNLASAMLIQGERSKVTLVSRASLADVPRGPRIGVDGLPDAVPSGRDLLYGGWLLCPVAAGNASAPGLGVNFDPSVHAVPVPPDRYVAVRTQDGRVYLLLRGAKHFVPETSTVATLGLTAEDLPVVATTMLDLVPNGPQIAAADIPGSGRPGPIVAGSDRRVGDLFVHLAGNGTERYFVLLDQGLAPLSATEFALLAAGQGASVSEVDAASVLSATKARDESLLSRLPDLARMTRTDKGDGLPCLRQVSAGTEVSTTVVLSRSADLLPARRALLPPAKGVLVAEQPIPAGQKIPDRYLITDDGRRYLLSDNDSIKALGLGEMQPMPMRTEVLSMIPAGPALSRRAAVTAQGG